MLDDTLKAQLASYLERVTLPIEMVASLDDSSTSAEMRELLQDEATDKEPPAEVCSIEQVITFLASDGFSKDDLDYSLLLIGKQHRSATAYAVYLADLELSKAIVANDLQRIAEMMMVSLLRDPSIDPSQFRELLEQLPAKERMKSYSRIRLEKILDGVATPEE